MYFVLNNCEIRPVIKQTKEMFFPEIIKETPPRKIKLIESFAKNSIINKVILKSAKDKEKYIKSSRETYIKYVSSPEQTNIKKTNEKMGKTFSNFGFKKLNLEKFYENNENLRQLFCKSNKTKNNSICHNNFYKTFNFSPIDSLYHSRFNGLDNKLYNIDSIDKITKKVSNNKHTKNMIRSNKIKINNKSINKYQMDCLEADFKFNYVMVGNDKKKKFQSNDTSSILKSELDYKIKK